MVWYGMVWYGMVWEVTLSDDVAVVSVLVVRVVA